MSTSRGDVKSLDLSPPKSGSVFDVGLGKGVFAGLTLDEVHTRLEGRSLLLLLMRQDTSQQRQGILVGAKTSILDNDYFRSRTIEITDTKTIEPYNTFGLPLQQPQYIAVINDVGLALDAFSALAMNDTFALKVKIMMALQKVDETQSYLQLGMDLRWLVGSWIDSIVNDNYKYWKNLHDTFPALFSIRRFRLEIKDLIDPVRNIDENKARIITDDVTGRVENLVNDVKTWIRRHGVNLEDYQRINAEDRKYADAYDAKFKAKAPDNYEDDMKKEELMYIVGWLQRFNEKGLMIRLWCALATSFDLYHLAWYAPFHQIVNDIDSFAIMRQYLKHLVYLMYREESNVRHGSTIQHRHVVSLKALEDINWLVCPETYPTINTGTLLPRSSNLKNDIGRLKVGFKMRSVSEYKRRLGQVSQGTLLDIKIPGVYVTGGLSALCLIRNPVEAKSILDWCQFTEGDPARPNHENILRRVAHRTLAREHVLDLMDKKPYYCSNFEDVKDKAFEDALRSSAYVDADIDVPIFANSLEEFMGKLTQLQNHIIAHWPEQREEKKGAGEQKEEKKRVVIFEHYKGDRHRLQLPNKRWIEAFYMNSTKETPFSLIFDFHVPPVRHFYDPSIDDVLMLPSCLWAGWTGLCLDIKYFGSSKDPMDIIIKYIQRGFTFILNTFEEVALARYNSAIGNQISLYFYAGGLPHSIIRAWWDINDRKGKEINRYTSYKLWKPIIISKNEIHTEISPFEYPVDPYVSRSKAEADEEPELGVYVKEEKEMKEGKRSDVEKKEGKRSEVKDEGATQWYKRRLLPPDQEDIYIVTSGVPREVVNVIKRMSVQRMFPGFQVMRTVLEGLGSVPTISLPSYQTNVMVMSGRAQIEQGTLQNMMALYPNAPLQATVGGTFELLADAPARLVPRDDEVVTIHTLDSVRRGAYGVAKVLYPEYYPVWVYNAGWILQSVKPEEKFLKIQPNDILHVYNNNDFENKGTKTDMEELWRLGPLDNYIMRSLDGRWLMFRNVRPELTMTLPESKEAKGGITGVTDDTLVRLQRPGYTPMLMTYAEARLAFPGGYLNYTPQGTIGYYPQGSFPPPM